MSRPPASLTTTTTTTASGAAALSPAAASPGEDATLSVSSDSVSLPTQVEVRRAGGAAALAQKLSEASLDDNGEAKAAEKSDPVEAAAPAAPEVKGEVAAKAPPTAKEEGPQDLRVFELNSDSGKSTPSNNGKKGRRIFFSEGGR